MHFLPGDPADTIAQKALRVNLSDLAAKGATPLAYTLSLGLPADIDEAWLAAFADGLEGDQRHFGISLLGGDTISVPKGPVVSITAFGLVPKGRMVHRFGGRPGDELYVSGMIGAGAAGLALLKGEAGPWSDLPEAERAALIARYRVPEPRVALSAAILEHSPRPRWMSPTGSSAIATSSARPPAAPPRSTRALCRFRRAFLRRATRRLLARLLTAGDDFEILAAVPPAEGPAVFAPRRRPSGAGDADRDAGGGRRPDQSAVQGRAASSIKTRLCARRSAEETR